MVDKLPSNNTDEALPLAKTMAVNASYLSEDETKQILTPFAFEVDKSLFGLPLSVPWKRGVALLIDFLLIAILAETPGEVLALVVAITFYRLGSKKRAQQMGKKFGFRKKLLRFSGAFIIFVVLVATIPDLIDEISGGEDSPADTSLVNLNGSGISVSDSIALTALAAKVITELSQSECKTYDCWHELAAPLVRNFTVIDAEDVPVGELVKDIVDEMSLSKAESKKMAAALMAEYKQGTKLEQTADNELVKNNNLPTSSKGVDVKGDKEQSFVYKGVEWTKGVINDLGLSFGWAAFYFSVLTAAWSGQTPGKKLLNIRVIQLDGTPLSIWDSFGRYGGYAAGLATGLMGFAQIYWDPNRQAIHDKISSTIVIDLKKLNKMENSKE